MTVKDPSQFNPPTEAKKVTFEDEKAPVFDLNKMIQEEAEKLKNQVTFRNKPKKIIKYIDRVWLKYHL